MVKVCFLPTQLVDRLELLGFGFQYVSRYGSLHFFFYLDFTAAFYFVSTQVLVQNLEKNIVELTHSYSLSDDMLHFMSFFFVLLVNSSLNMHALKFSKLL